jgi:hypothetical protein
VEVAGAAHSRRRRSHGGFSPTVDIERRLLAKGVKVETPVLPDDVHDSLLWRNWTMAVGAMARFFERTLQK